MHYYLELPQAEIARVLELHPRKASYLWITATEKLGEALDAALCFMIREMRSAAVGEDANPVDHPTGLESSPTGTPRTPPTGP
jgi:hypothetical protein